MVLLVLLLKQAKTRKGRTRSGWFEGFCFLCPTGGQVHLQRGGAALEESCRHLRRGLRCKVVLTEHCWGSFPQKRSALKPGWVWRHQVQAPARSGCDSANEQPNRELVQSWGHPRWGLCGGHRGQPSLSPTLVLSCTCRDTCPPQAASLAHLGWGVQMMQVESWTRQEKTSVLITGLS